MTYADGSKYDGEWKMGRRHGQGTYVYANSDYYSGKWAGGVRHGLGLYFFSSSKSQFYGFWDKNGFVAGTWVFIDGTTFVGKFEGKPLTLPRDAGNFLFSNGNKQRVKYVVPKGWKPVGFTTGAHTGRANLDEILAELKVSEPEETDALEAYAPDMIPVPPKIILTGAPASGKGKLSEMIVQKYGVRHVNTGELIRNAMQSQSDSGLVAKTHVERGQPVPDDALVQIVVDALMNPVMTKEGWILDGFPRTKEQALALKEGGMVPDVYLVLDLPDDVLIDACLHRRLDPVTGKMFHIVDEPPPSEIEERLLHREEDTEEVLVSRLRDYHRNVEAIASVFSGHVRSVDGDRPAKEVFDEMCKRIENIAVAPRVVLAGAPASGKGAHCERIMAKYRKLVHVTTGEAIKVAAAARTDLGMRAKAYMENGDTVPDEVLIPIMIDYLRQEKVQRCGWLLDGWPRTAKQAAAMCSAKMQPHVFLVIDVPDELVIERCVERRWDPVDGTMFHLQYDPPPPGEVAERLVQRRTDSKEHVLAMLSEHHHLVSEVGGIFHHRMRRLDGTQPDDSILSEIEARIEGKVVGPKIIICGAPASGKGKQCQRILTQLGVRHVSAGEVVRKAAADPDNELGQQAKSLLEAGQTIPDELQAEIVAADLNGTSASSEGWILDGYPRNKAQATALQRAGVSPHCILDLVVDEQELVDRQRHRRLDPVTGKLYNMQTDPPDSAEVAERLVQRVDDIEENIRERLRIAESARMAVLSTWPHVVHKINGNRADDFVAADIVHVLKLQR
eukprot:SAG31_NODE_1271_length_9064_cov_10.148912_10_plen_786_part_00